MSQPFEPPAGYWLMLRRMYDLLVGSDAANDWLLQRKCEAVVDPSSINAPRGSSRERATVGRVLGQWRMESIEQLATILGVNWIWFNETERARHMKELPPLIGLALMVGSVAEDLKQTQIDGRREAANNESLKVAA